MRFSNLLIVLLATAIALPLAAQESPPEAPAAKGDPALPFADTLAEPAVAPPPPPAAPIVQPLQPLTRAQRAAAEAAAERGRLLVTIARAGIVATQDMLSRISNPEAAGIAGWLAEPAGNATLVTFYADGEPPSRPVAVYRVTVQGSRAVSREIHLGEARPALNPLLVRMAQARAAAAAQEHRPCAGDQFNYLVVPPATATAPIAVYQVTPGTRAGIFPVGGHFRTLVAADGTIAETRATTGACADLAVPAEATAVPELAHALDPTPSEMHVFLAQLLGRPLVVTAGDPPRAWTVTNEAIAERP